MPRDNYDDAMNPTGDAAGRQPGAPQANDQGFDRVGGSSSLGGEQRAASQGTSGGSAFGVADAFAGAALTLGETARQAARATLGAVSEQASALTSSVAAELTTIAETEKSRGADAILGFARAIDRASSELDEQSPQIARAFRSAAENVETFSDTLRGERVNDLFAAGADYARRQPLAFFAGALIAGFAASRFLLSHKESGARSNPQDMAGSELRPGMTP
jgi:hypothetical protein